MTNAMAEGLNQYLITTKHNEKRQVKRLSIDSCGMKDNQLHQILKAVERQGQHIKQIVYVNNEIGPQSIPVLCDLMRSIRELQFSNVANCGTRVLY